MLMLMIEPTPYILGFLREVRKVWKGEVDVFFTCRNLSQAWDEAPTKDFVLEGSFFSGSVKLWSLLKNNRYTLVHLAGWSQPLVFIALLICAVRRISVSVETDTSPHEETLAWRYWMKRLIYPLIFKIPQLFIPGGTRQAQYLSSYGVPAKKIRIAQMTVDVEELQAYKESAGAVVRDSMRSQYGFTEDTVVFLFVGRLEAYKGICELLEAYRQLRESGHTSSALLMVGDGAYRGEAEMIASVVDGVTITGRLSGADLFNAYIISDIMVVPSLVEPWGLVVNEAMAFGLPVIASDNVGCSDDLVIHEVTGLIVPAGQTEALVNALQKLALNASLRKAYAKKSSEHIRPWTLSNEAQKVTGAWLEVIGEN